jgi:hypothetical protein
VADRLYLSLWVHGFSPTNLLRHFERLLAAFPFSKLSRSESVLRIYALEYSEPPLVEFALPNPADPAAIVAQARQFQNADSCYELTTAWDLWRWDGDWALAPVRVVISCFGPEFENDSDENFRIDFGQEDQFLPGPGGTAGMKTVRANIQSLLRLVHDLDERLTVAQRRLWSESGGNFAERLQSALGQVQEEG